MQKVHCFSGPGDGFVVLRFTIHSFESYNPQSHDLKGSRVMSKKMAVAVAFVLLVAGPAAAQDENGKIPWKRDVKSAMADARARGMGMMLYFTSEG